MAPDVFSNNDAATTSDGVDPPTPVSTGRISTGHVPLPHVPGSLSATEYQSPTFDSHPVEFPQLGNHMYGNDVYPAPELVPGGYEHTNGGGTGLPQIDPSLTGRGEGLDGSANISYSASFLDPALQQYPQHPDSNGYPPMNQYVPPPMDMFPSWFLGEDFDLAAFNKSFQPPTAAEFLGLDGTHAEHQWNNHDMPSTETGGNLSLRIAWDRDLIPDVGFMVSFPLLITSLANDLELHYPTISHSIQSRVPHFARTDVSAHRTQPAPLAFYVLYWNSAHGSRCYDLTGS